MEKTFIGVRDIDVETFRKFRSMAVANKMKLGDALTKAMKNLIEQRGEVNKPDMSNFLKVKPLKGDKKVRWGTEVDEILYGWKK